MAQDSGSNGRLDRIEAALQNLAERHRALSETVEIIAGMQRENEERFTRNEERVGRLIDAMTSLVRIVEGHQRRLDDLESR